jgi:hypothetical protein
MPPPKGFPREEYALGVYILPCFYAKVKFKTDNPKAWKAQGAVVRCPLPLPPRLQLDVALPQVERILDAGRNP